MGTTKEDVAGVALSLIRANPISSFDDGSNEANIITANYSPLIRKLMTLHPWGFALKKRLLNQNATDPVNEYTYSHIIPSEVQRIFRLYDSSSVGALPISDYKIVGTNIFSNHSQLWAEYTVYTAESNWPAYFADFAAYAVAARIAMIVTDDDTLAARLEQRAYGPPSAAGRGGEFAIAANIDSQQQPAQTIQTSELISFRFS